MVTGLFPAISPQEGEGSGNYQFGIEINKKENPNLGAINLSTPTPSIQFIDKITLLKTYYESNSLRELTISMKDLWNIIDNYTKVKIEVNRFNNI